MHQNVIFTIESNEPLTDTVFRMVLCGNRRFVPTAGQFVMVELPNLFLRRPFSVCDYNENSITLIYKVLGKGTAQMSRLKVGKKLKLIVGLGNGFDTTVAQKNPLLIGGGVGVPPLHYLAKKLLKKGLQPTVLMGFNTKSEVFLAHEFEQIGCQVKIATCDGSLGTHGVVTDILKNEKVVFDYFYACGPLPMLRAVCQAIPTDGQLSLEERMGCGFGTCLGCSIMTKNGAKRVCKEGPVFKKYELIL